MKKSSEKVHDEISLILTLVRRKRYSVSQSTKKTDEHRIKKTVASPPTITFEPSNTNQPLTTSLSSFVTKYTNQLVMHGFIYWRTIGEKDIIVMNDYDSKTGLFKVITQKNRIKKPLF